MRKTFKQVHPEDFDVEALMAVAREGKLYIDESKQKVNKEQRIIKVRAYVGRIKVFVTPKFRLLVDKLWEENLASLSENYAIVSFNLDYWGKSGVSVKFSIMIHKQR